MKNHMGGSYFENVKRSFMLEFISMNFMMAGMAPVMSFLMMGRDMRAMVPTELLFWGVMSLGVMAGFVFAYPSNVWLVSKRLKHGLMTQRKIAPSNSCPEHGQIMQLDFHTRHEMKADATTAQIAAVSLVSTVVLATGMIAPANWVNLSLSAHDVGNLIMTPGMLMERSTTAEAMREMSFADARQVKIIYPVEARGDTELPFTMDGDVKVFELTASVIRWSILPDVAVDAYAYNGQIPGPRIHLREGDHVRVHIHNKLPEKTTIHWHGLIVPNALDGAADITQAPIESGDSYTYEFTVTQHGAYLYHPHASPDRTQALGLYGTLIIDPASAGIETLADHEYVIQLQEWLVRDGLTFPAMPMDGMQPNYFTINGKSYPSTESVHMKLGETLKIRFIGTNNGFVHPMHIHGGPFEVVARDGLQLSNGARYSADTINIAPGQRYDVIWRAREKGKWLIHCHIPHHTNNNSAETKGGGGLMAIIEVE
jgi:FtsP/CotA-like multicopper oxidase with cupredoxin domain